MLTEERLLEILRLVNEKGSITNRELMQLLGASESTIRRDITMLAAEGALQKVHGGAISKQGGFKAVDDDISIRRTSMREEKYALASRAAEMITDEDFVYIDAGTTTECLVELLKPSGAVFVTNALLIAKALAEKGFDVYLPGGKFKAVTGALVGSEAVEAIGGYNFTKGFFGTNGISASCGFTTPDPREAAVKRAAIKKCKSAYVLATTDKFNKISPVEFAKSTDAAVICSECPKGFEEFTAITVNGGEAR